MTDRLLCPSCGSDRVRFTGDGAWCFCTDSYEDTDETEIQFCPFCAAPLTGNSETEREAVHGIQQMCWSIRRTRDREDREQERAARAARNWSEPMDHFLESMDRLQQGLELQVVRMLTTPASWGNQ